ncbi:MULTISPECIES: TonB-dependent receptor [unclassified Lentimonas]|uniref:TonB-dependent receptor n=1 Tax=unclassified Lentimonas TaxID=2630993 RepID=UPI0013243A53|nr:MULTISPECIES: TonB-dependent receptor [unclassified Lentimonas]CAA6676468.1 Zinc-regulated outer membrane receptor [Lentimonas sp. CC4]CAA6685308.1 Zinc-regulated outer membrane receptor [Lentimonas sp. CC6]CAA7074968.1 Zinc-regulated outer membrane receptor [Lentimonas sp. CC4]CAA7171013.1 Zinc-regulated outer membrane receptor [Lentimonas sp. CC21]CAA7180609.1 Zinc-regulated outer membrane receptor [Lentimonas sp. CC8]
MNHFFIKSGALLCATTLFYSANAEDTETTYELEDYVVFSGSSINPLEDYAAPVSVIDEQTLQRDTGGTLASALDWQPGVSTSAFSSGASRPILRGFDGPRVRILNSGIESLDASSISPDHGTTIEPLLTDSVEILRGPSTLLYGSSAIGGAVNVIGKEMPRERLDPDKNIEGAVEARHSTVSDGDTYLGYATVGEGDWAVSVTGLKRNDDDYEIPSDAQEDGEGDTLDNSFFESESYSIGGSWFFGETSRIGFAYSHYDSKYGVPGHEHHDHGGGGHHDDDENVHIDLDSDQYDMDFEVAEPFEGIEALRVRLGYTDYQHKEIEGSEVGTKFENEGWELRTEAVHSPWSIIDEGMIGIQLSDTDFSAKGEEAFTPPATTKTQALFFSEHIHGDVMRYEFGGRVERSDITAKGVHDDYDDLALSVAIAATWQINPSNELSLVLQRSQRNPNSTELYADGPHLATQQYEIGDTDLEQETAYGIDLTYLTRQDRWKAEFSVFYTYFDDYIFAEDLGYETDHLDTYQFVAVDAQFYGFETSVDTTLFESSESSVVLSLMSDYVRALNDDDDDDLPRTPPLRVGSRLGMTHGLWDAGIELRYAFKQNNVADNETETDGYTQLNVDLSRRVEFKNNIAAVFFVRGENLLDEEIRYSTSYLKDEAPLPGINFTMGSRIEF